MNAQRASAAAASPQSYSDPSADPTISTRSPLLTVPSQTLQPADEGEGGIILGKKGAKTGKGANLPSKSEIATLRTTIQTLCQASNPLGRKCRRN